VLGPNIDEFKCINLMFWADLPQEIQIKTYLTLHAVEMESTEAGLSSRERNIVRWAALFLYIGRVKPSKTSKVYIYSFLSTLYIL